MAWLAVPAAAFLVMFFLWPLVEMVRMSLTDPRFGLGNYQRVATNPAIVRSLGFTVGLSLLVTAICAVIGYIYCYTAVRSGSTIRGALLGLVLLPAAVSLLVRVFSLQVILQDQGLINRALMALGLTDRPLPLIRTPFAIGLGMVSSLLPFMVFPLYSTMSRIDDELLLAANSLGATPTEAFTKVFFPLSRPGLLAGSLLVFVSSLGYYVVPQLLGNNASDRFLSQYTALYVAQGDWGFGAAIGVTLLLVTGLTLLVAGRLVNVGETLRTSVGGGR